MPPPGIACEKLVMTQNFRAERGIPGAYLAQSCAGPDSLPPTPTPCSPLAGVRLQGWITARPRPGLEAPQLLPGPTSPSSFSGNTSSEGERKYQGCLEENLSGLRMPFRGASTPQARLQMAVLGAPNYNPRPPTDSIISLPTKMQLWLNFNLYKAVCFIL